MKIQILIFVLDTLLINAAFLISFLIRYGWHLPEKNFEVYKSNFLFLTFIYMLTFAIVRVFKRRFVCHWDLVKRVIAGAFLGTLCCFMFIYVFRYKWAAFPSSILAITFPTGIIIISLVNLGLLRFSGRILKRVVVIGGKKSEMLFDEEKLVQRIYLDKFEEIPMHRQIDEIVLCERLHGDSQLNLLLFLFMKSKVDVVFAPSLYADLLSGNITEEHTIDFLATFIGRKSEWEEFLIRSLDVISSISILLVTSPILILATILIKLTSHGPIFYLQKRSGKDGLVFTLIKFRTMVNNAEDLTGPVLASDQDGRVTPVGRFLRQTRIDEFPQLINVLMGHMSMVGPRPERPHFTKIHKALRGIRMAVRPGLTGLAQIRSSYDIRPQHKIKYDYLYIQRRSVFLNIYLMIKTIPVMLLRKGI
jgi:lipopolysaccharide/colanic/teichoic acid biosynthesis glycosyltransferase